MKAELTNQTSKLQNQQCKATSENTIALSKSIIKGEKGVLAQMEMNLTVALTLDKPIIRSVFKGEAGSILYSVVNVLVTRFVDSFGFSTKHSEQQIETITVDTLEAFNYESLEDIVLFFKMARSGKLGTTQRGIDSNLIFGDWFSKYMELKSEAREKQYEKEKSERNSKPVTMEDVQKQYEINTAPLRKEKYLQKVSDYVDKITQEMNRETLEKTILEWEADEEKKPYVRILKKKRREIKI